MSGFPLAAIRQQFPALSRRVGDLPAVFFDGPAGSQVPQRVIDAISGYFVNCNANHGGVFATSRESDALILETEKAVADFLGSSDHEIAAFGGNMTSLTFAVSRALATQWKPGDEILVTRLDHDANVSPWVRAAQDRGITVKHIDIHPEDCTIDMDDFRKKLSPKTKFLAVGCASNAVGTRNPIREMIRLTHEVGGLVFLDAVHYAPHARIAVEEWGCDLLACSAYKFFGPHIGILWAKRQLLESLPAYKVRPAPETLPDRWMTGTQNFACITGVGAAIEYLASLGRSLDASAKDRRQALDVAFEAIVKHETQIGSELLRGLLNNPSIRVWGITEENRWSERVPTFGFRHHKRSPKDVAEFLSEKGIFVWHGNYYALPLTERLGLEPEGMVRVGLLHYNTSEEVQRLLEALKDTASAHR